MRQVLASVVALFVLLSAPLHAGGDAATDTVAEFGVDVARAIGPAHPEGSEFMRLNHMDLLRHDRDLTMHLGDRNVRYSIKQCVTCHATRGPQGKPLPVTDEGQFCAACHAKAAVRIDCFECHSRLPDRDTANLLVRKYPDNADLKALADYLNGVTE